MKRKAVIISLISFLWILMVVSQIYLGWSFSAAFFKLPEETYSYKSILGIFSLSTLDYGDNGATYTQRSMEVFFVVFCFLSIAGLLLAIHRFSSTIKKRALILFPGLLSPFVYYLSILISENTYRIVGYERWTAVYGYTVSEVIVNNFGSMLHREFNLVYQLAIFLYFVLILRAIALWKKNKDDDTDAFNKALEAYKLDKSDKSCGFVLFLSERMLKNQRVEDAIRGIEAVNQNKPSAEYYKKLGIWYARLKNNDKVIENLKASYQMEKNAKVAYDLGVLLNKIDIDSAINYLAESYLLNDEKYSGEALKFLQQLVFYVKPKGQPQAEQEKAYNDVLASAKTRLGITSPLSDAK